MLVGTGASGETEQREHCQAQRHAAHSTRTVKHCPLPSQHLRFIGMDGIYGGVHGSTGYDEGIKMVSVSISAFVTLKDIYPPQLG